MTQFTTHTGICAALPRANVDTDQIIPKQFLKRIERTGFGPALFHDWRYRPDGSPDPAFPLNAPKAAGASILLAGANFGCGSSREHAPWALGEYGFRAILAESFADIFFNNCCQNGILPVRLHARVMSELFGRYDRTIGPFRVTVDLERCRVSDSSGLDVAFEIDSYRREMLLKGLDEIGRTLLAEQAIAKFERRRARDLAGVSE
ncbi:MAG TPA: 3-isopropylmalate dehydratase small subunit [Gemmatimonadales bacterium]|nr:3-isopropylmalate dehydratase small subunit [Gemmatimonadales bacterium]